MLFLSEACETSSFLKVIYFIMELLKVASIIIPIGLVIMMSVDFMKNVISKQDDMNKNLKIAIKRVIYCLVIFLIPTIVNISVSLLNKSGIELDYNVCLSNANLDTIRYYEEDEKLAKEEEKYIPDTPKDPGSNRTIIANDSNGSSSDNGGSSTGNSDSNNEDSSDSDSLEGSKKILRTANKYYEMIERSGKWAHNGERASHPNAPHYTSCCYLVSNILKNAGYLKSGTLCHANSGSMPDGYKKLKNMKIIKTRDMTKLQPGDIMVKNGSSHNIAIFAYKKNGNYYVYGASDTAEIRQHNHPSSNKSGWWKRHGITAIVRAKN